MIVKVSFSGMPCFANNALDSSSVISSPILTILLRLASIVRS